MKKRMRPSPALVISLIALFVALGGTSYAAITAALPANSVGTIQIRNRAVTPAKLNSTVLTPYLKYGGTLPSGKTETGNWGFGTTASGTAGFAAWPVFSFPVPLAAAISGKAIYVSGASATHCAGIGHADPGYLCVYQSVAGNVAAGHSTNVFNPVTNINTSANRNGFGIFLQAAADGAWYVFGTYAVTAP